MMQPVIDGSGLPTPIESSSNCSSSTSHHEDNQLSQKIPIAVPMAQNTQNTSDRDKELDFPTAASSIPSDLKSGSGMTLESSSPLAAIALSETRINHDKSSENNPDIKFSLSPITNPETSVNSEVLNDSVLLDAPIAAPAAASDIAFYATLPTTDQQKPNTDACAKSTPEASTPVIAHSGDNLDTTQSGATEKSINARNFSQNFKSEISLDTQPPSQPDHNVTVTTLQQTRKSFLPELTEDTSARISQPSSPSLSPALSLSPVSAHTTPASLSSRKLRSNNSVIPKTTPPPPLFHQTCKPSPGLAARLKALGFGSTTPGNNNNKATSSTPILLDRNGGLVQSQARQLEESHQAGSASNLSVKRRGRPWKGITTAVHNVISRKASFESSKSTRSASDCGNSILLPSPTHDEFNTGLASPASVSSSFLAPHHSPSLLPEVELAELLNMDTKKYSLPDQENKTGVKIPVGIVNENFNRHSPPSPLDIVPSIETDDFNTKKVEEQCAGPPPPPRPKDTPLLQSAQSAATVSSINSEYFVPRHGRAGSIYTLSRASFTNQLAQLTSLQLPDAESLLTKVAAIPAAHTANNALINAAEQIRGWILKASEVIEGLDSDDDVEWSAAGGREGLEEVEKAIMRFEELINIYISAVEDLQRRNDIGSVSPNDLQKAVVQMDAILTEWLKIRKLLQAVKEQVEIAMEWGELWNNVLGDIQKEMDELSRLIFEMEERRHQSLAIPEGGADVDSLDTIVEEAPNPNRLGAQNRFSMPPFPMSPGSPNTPTLTLDDSSLLALFARMQPLRASLDFLPMRLSVFQNRASSSFPTACDELEMRRVALDGCYKRLEKDAESLRKELGEDRWISVFRNAGRQAEKMYESVHRSVDKLQEAIDAGYYLTNQPAIYKKIESYEAKKTHYGPAIERVLSIIDKGVKDRLTVNGEILRLHAETQSKWVDLKLVMADMDVQLEEVQTEMKTQQLRDSISSFMSTDHASTVGSGRETPGSSPPSSIIMSSLGPMPKTPLSVAKRSRAATAVSVVPQNRRYSSLPPSTTQPSLVKKASISRLAALAQPNPAKTPNRLTRPPSTSDLRPKWNFSTNTKDLDTGHNFVPLTLTTPSPYAKKHPSDTTGATRSSSSLSPNANSGSRLPRLRNFSVSPRSSTGSPVPMEDTPSRNSQSRLSFRECITAAAPGPYAQQTLQKTRANSQSAGSSSTPKEIRRASYQPRMLSSVFDMGSSPSRPSSLMTFNPRRSSVLTLGRMRAESTDGRASPASRAGGSRLGMRKATEAPKDNKPRWRI